jgi:excisionase family DNA binding protein
MESRKRKKRPDEDRSIDERLDKLANDIRKLPPERIKQLEKVMKSMGKKVLSLKEAAEMLDVSIDTIRRAIKSGSLNAFQLNKEGNWKIPIEEVERFMKGGKDERH